MAAEIRSIPACNYRLDFTDFVKIIEDVFIKTAIFCLKNLFFLAENRYFCSVKSVKIGHFFS